MIASLPMYATPRTAGADARLWALIRDGLRAKGLAAPGSLTLAPGDLIAHWRDPSLVLSQTCGLPYRAVLRDQVTLVGTPDYGVNGCPPGFYRSLVVARQDDARTHLDDYADARFAYNDPLSQSGWAALAMAAPHVLNGPLLHSSSHRGSVLAVGAGQADFAAIDAVSWRHLTATNDAAGLKIVHETEPTPGLPLICANGYDGAMIHTAVAGAISALDADDLAVLNLRGLVALSQSAYDLPLPPQVCANRT